jgi:predicted TIM-barrel fold metal-dependent hydrolase
VPALQGETMQAFCFFDSHFHIIDPRFPLVANNNFLPSWFTVNQYHERLKKFNVLGGAVVSGSFQGFDQTYLIAALRALGPTFVGVTQLPFTVLDEEILELDTAGVRALRFNLKRGGTLEPKMIESLAHRVYEIAGWHIELHIEARDLPELADCLINLPAVSIDHLGLTKAGFSTLLFLIEQGVKIKATGFGRVDFNIPQALKEISQANPDALMFGSDLPSTRAQRPFQNSDLTVIRESLGSQMAEKVLYLNALTFYRMPSTPFSFST